MATNTMYQVQQGNILNNAGSYMTMQKNMNVPGLPLNNLTNTGGLALGTVTNMPNNARQRPHDGNSYHWDNNTL